MDSGIETKLATIERTEQPTLPDYLVNTYTWAYLTPISIVLFDNQVFLTAMLWGNLPRLVRSATEEFSAGQHVLQAGNAYGPIAVELATVVGAGGRLDVIDVAPLQVEHVQRKLAGKPQARARVANASAPGNSVYDGVCSFFLLHELPDEQKDEVVNALLDRVVPGGKAVFIDYHQARPWHPLRLPMDLVFRWLEPFAHGLIKREIRDFARDADAFSWTKETYFGGLYQKVVAVRRQGEPPLDVPRS